MKFFQVLTWIILIIGLPAVLLTVFFHYRKKRLESKNPSNTEDEFMQASPELLGYTKGDGEYVFFDHSSLISEYKKKLSASHARYTALRRDFEKLESRYTDLADYAVLKNAGYKINEMKPGYHLPKPLQKEIAKLAAAYKEEKDKLLSRLEQINQSYKELETESRLLQDQLKMQTANEDEKTTILNQWKEEIVLLKEKLSEQQYVFDLLQEKKTQISFLQDQLEQRIKDNHLLDQKHIATIAVLEEERVQHKNLLQSLEKIKFELLQKQEEADKLHVVVCGKEEHLAEKQDQLKAKEEHIAWLESTLNESKQQNITLNELLDEKRITIESLQQKLMSEQARSAELEEKLLLKEQETQQLYPSLISLHGKEKEEFLQKTVISMHDRGSENMAVH